MSAVLKLPCAGGLVISGYQKVWVASFSRLGKESYHARRGAAHAEAERGRRRTRAPQVGQELIIVGPRPGASRRDRDAGGLSVNYSEGLNKYKEGAVHLQKVHHATPASSSTTFKDQHRSAYQASR
jgi:hypothetical protein